MRRDNCGSCEKSTRHIERNHGGESPERIDDRRDCRPQDVAAGLNRLRYAREPREVLGRSNEGRERLERRRMKRVADSPEEERHHDHPHGQRARKRYRRHNGAHRRNEQIRSYQRALERQTVNDGPRKHAEQRKRQKARERSK